MVDTEADLTLVERLRSSDAAALETLMERYASQVYRLADWSQTPEVELLSRETQEILNRAIDGLPDQYRGVLVLRDVEGLSNEEAAEAVGDSVAAVKSRLHRARMALREELTRHLGPRRAS
jgi:RNA polymerase sigma-70 factor (ECF subfamily)